MRLFLSYCKSHIYDIHSIMAGTLALALMFLIKKPIKERIAAVVEQRALNNEKYRLRKEIYLKRYNGILVVLVMLIAFLFFGILSVFSPFIHFSVPSAIMSGAISLAEYAFIEQLCIRGNKL